MMEDASAIGLGETLVDEVVDSKSRRALTEQEAAYMRGGAEPHASSILTSTSKYLNNPYFRDTFAQFALRKTGNDVAPTYLIPKMVHALADVRDDAEYLRLTRAEKEKNPAFAAWLARRRLTRYLPDEMRHHAPGTLGAAIRDFIERSGMQMEFMKAGLEPRNDVEYMIRRRAALHDIEHMVTGFGPNPLGEAALAVMNVVSYANHFSPQLSQYMGEANMFVSVTSLYRNTLHTPEITRDLFKAWELAIVAGNSIRMPLMLVDWEEKLDMTPEQIAEELGFVRGPGAGWDYSSELIHV